MRESRKKEGRGGLRTRHSPSGDTEVGLMLGEGGRGRGWVGEATHPPVIQK